MSRTEQPEHWAYELKVRTVRLLRLLNALPPAYLSRLAERYLRRPDQPGRLVRSTSHQPVSTNPVRSPKVNWRSGRGYPRHLRRSTPSLGRVRHLPSHTST